MAGETQLQIFLTANIASFQEQLRAALGTFKDTTSQMRGVAAELSVDLGGTTVDAAASFAQLNPAIQESAANYLRVREALQEVSTAIRETDALIADAGGIEGVNNDVIAQWSAETTSQILLQKELTAALASYKAVLSDTFAAQQANIKLQQDAATASRNRALASADAAASEYSANTGAAASEAEATAEDNARTVALARLIGLKEADAAVTRSKAVAEVAATEQASAGYTRLAQAQIASTRAQVELRAAQSNAVDLIGLEGTTTNELALSMERASVASAELAAAQEALAGGLKESGEAAEVFRARMIVGENGLRAFVTTTLTSLPLLAAVFATTFAIRATDAMDEVILRTADLARATGMAQSSIVALGHAAEETGAKSDDLESVMRRLDRTISDAMSGSKDAALSLKELGVDITQFHGVIPPTLTVLAQMADFMRLNAGNAEVMRAGQRALGTDSPQFLAWLSQGATGLQEQANKYLALGNAETAELSNARELKSQEEKLGATWDSLKLSLIGATNAMLGWLFVNKPADGDIIDQGVHQIALAWSNVTGSIEAATKANNEYMRGVLSGAVAAPKGIFGAGGLTAPAPPDIATAKSTPAKKVPFESQMSEFREELRQEDAAFEGSEEDKLQMERDFWSAVIDTNRAAGKDIIAVRTQIAALTVAIAKEELKQQESTDKEVADSKQRSFETAKQELAALVALERQANREEVENVKYLASVSEEAIRGELQEAEAGFSLKRARINELASLDLTTKREQRTALEQLQQAEDAAQLKALQAQLAVLEAGKKSIEGLKDEQHAIDEFGRKIADVYRQMGVLSAKVTAENVSNQTQAAARIAEAYTHVFSTIESSMQKTINGMLLGTQSFARGMAQLWNGIVISIVNDMAKMLLEHIRHAIAMTIITQQSEAQQVAAVTAGETAKTAAKQAGSSSNIALELAQSLKSIAIAAAQAAAHAFKWVMTEVPFPANVALAPAAAAAAFAATIAFGGKAGSAAMGAMLGEDTLVNAHAGEMIVPANLSRQLLTAMSLPSSVSRGLGGLASSAINAGSSITNNTKNQRINVEQNFHNSGDVNHRTVAEMMRQAIKRGTI